MEKLQEIYEQLKNLNGNLRHDDTTWIDSRTYIKHVELLLSELENAKRQSDSWELEYHRSKS